MLSFFAAVGSVLLLGANTLGLQRLRIDTASTREDYRRLRHRVVVALGATAVVFGLMVGAWIAMIATMESLNGGLAVLVNVVATGSLLRGGRIVWLLAVTRRPGGRQRVAAT
jgi:UDP-N-acetylmuramyl pentapeptide phosphotransferase/UDP-N-acetylglucosamine-1-phosphate transferase